MSQSLRDDPESRKAYEDFQRVLRQKSKEERETLIQQAREEALAEDLARAREKSEREAEAERAALERQSPAEEAFYAREQAKSAALLLILLLLILLLIAAATGRSDILRLPGAQPAEPTIAPRLSDSDAGGAVVANSRPLDLRLTPLPESQVSPIFQQYYRDHGGAAIFGLPISPELRDVNGRRYQWYERARLEDWPELADKGYAVLGGRLGVEFLGAQARNFPKQTPFVSQDGVRYFPETGHGVSDRFLQFWNEHDGMRILGYPLSDQLQEMLPNNRIHTVQYFERGRLEYHPENPPPNDMQLGLLGWGLFRNEDSAKVNLAAAPTLIPAPTPVPLPPSAQPTPVPPASSVR